MGRTVLPGRLWHQSSTASLSLYVTVTAGTSPVRESIVRVGEALMTSKHLLGQGLAGRRRLLWPGGRDAVAFSGKVRTLSRILGVGADLGKIPGVVAFSRSLAVDPDIVWI